MPVSTMVTADVLTMRALRRSLGGSVQVPCHSGINQLVQLAIMAGRPPGPEATCTQTLPCCLRMISHHSGLALIVVNQTQSSSQACVISERSANFGSVLLRQSVESTNRVIDCSGATNADLPSWPRHPLLNLDGRRARVPKYIRPVRSKLLDLLVWGWHFSQWARGVWCGVRIWR